MNGSWCNNAISKKLNEEYPHDFSICDIDGVCRTYYQKQIKPYPLSPIIYKSRLVIYESKHEGEKISNTQLDTLDILQQNMKWENFDDKSGVFIIKHDDELNELKIYTISNISKNIKTEYKLNFIKKLSFDEFYNWISVKDQKKILPRKTK